MQPGTMAAGSIPPPTPQQNRPGSAFALTGFSQQQQQQREQTERDMMRRESGLGRDLGRELEREEAMRREEIYRREELRRREALESVGRRYTPPNAMDDRGYLHERGYLPPGPPQSGQERDRR